jgi:WD40 repeat protein
MAFAPNDRRLVAACRGSARVDVWRLDPGRGIQILRGLVDPASQFCYSPDGMLLAARTHNGQVGVWDLKNGSLRLLMESPELDFSPDAAMTFGPEGNRLAVSGGERAVLCDVRTGKVLRRWKLPPGSNDALAFPTPNQFFLLRSEAVPAETHSGTPGQPARVCRVRNLLSADPMKLLLESMDFNRHFLAAVASPDGSRFIVEGIQQSSSGQHRTIAALDAATGEVRWSLPSTRSDLKSELALDSQGELLAVRTGNPQNHVSLVDTTSGRTIETLDQLPLALLAGREYWVQFGPGDAASPGRANLVAQQSASAFTCVLSFPARPGLPPAFSKVGSRLAWSNADGTISVCCLEDVRRNFSQVGLGW